MINNLFFGKIIILILSCIGFLIAFYVSSKKQKQNGIVCPFRTKCGKVLESGHSKFMGMPVEMMGMAYYGILTTIYALVIFIPVISSPFLLFVLMVLTTLAFFFSLYLIGIQAFVIRAWCSWCLMSALISVFIFLSTFLLLDFGLIDLLSKHKGFFVLLHALSASIGVGAATITDIFFFKFLKDYKISLEESETMKTLSQVIWFALGALILTGLCLYLPDMARLNETPKFLVKSIIVFVLVLNGIFLNLLIQPKLVHISFGEPHKHKSGELHHLRKLAFALGGISIISWYFVFVLGSFKNVPFSFLQILLVYVGIIFVGIIGSQIFEYRVSQKKL